MAELPSGNDKLVAAQRILAVTEEELQRIVLDLHDGPVQQLFAAQAQMAALSRRAEGGEQISRREYEVTFQRVSRLLQSSLQEIRQFLGAFRPPDFAHRDLVEILRGLFLHHELTTGCEVRFTGLETAVSLPLAVKITLYRICQEALSNAFRHANSLHQQITLTWEGDNLVLTIADDGQGFNPPPLHGPQATEREEHIGLRGMRDRVTLVGGQFFLDSAPGKGTKITVRLPIDP